MAGRTTARRVGLVAGGALISLGLGGPPAAVGDQVTGTNGNDVLNGTPRPDTIDGLAGDDVLRGRASGDVLTDGPGQDLVVGGKGADVLRSLNVQFADDSDVLRGGLGPDDITAGDGDLAVGGPQDDVLAGFLNTGGLVMKGGFGADEVSAVGSGTARLLGGGGDDSLDLDGRQFTGAAGAGNDTILIRAADRASGGPGDDAISLSHLVERDRPGGVARVISGGPGDDVIQTWTGQILTPVSCGDGIDTVLVSIGQRWNADCESHFFFFEGEDCDGCDENDHIVGTADDDWVDAGIGDDRVQTLAGDDRIFLGFGSDVAAAGPGNDVVDATEEGSQQVDVVDATEEGSHQVDVVSCGAGFDVVVADPADDIDADCEVESLQPAP